MTKKRTVWFLAAVLMVIAGMSGISVQGEEYSVLAHWKFQDNSAYYTGSVDKDELLFTDLSGNGNHLQVGVEGNDTLSVRSHGTSKISDVAFAQCLAQARIGYVLRFAYTSNGINAIQFLKEIGMRGGEDGYLVE